VMRTKMDEGKQKESRGMSRNAGEG
jgi:hypothetical protein